MSARCPGLLLVATCAAMLSSAQATVEAQQMGVDARARALAQHGHLVDTHIDLPFRLLRHWEDVSVRTRKGDFDYVRAREGGLDVPFMSIYIPSRLEGTGKAKPTADSLIDIVWDLAARWPEKFKVVTSVRDVRDQAKAGAILLAMGMENGSALEGNLANVAYFHKRGIRYITIAHVKHNHLSDASFDKKRPWNGLSPFGRQVVAEMNRVGIMVDVSHLTDSAFYQVIHISQAPVIASHSSCRYFTPGFERNMSDTMLKALANNRGVIQINFGTMFIDDVVRRQMEKTEKAIRDHVRRRQWQSDGSQARAYAERYRKEHPYPHVDVARVAEHIQHVVTLVGIDHVGLGSDFEGLGDMLPVGLTDVSEYPNLIAALLKRGYSETDIEKICSGNILRVWAEVERNSEGGGTQ